MDAPLRILSLDGGGIRGISSLLILEHIMENIRDKEGLSSVPRSCDRFDLIGGTSTGGIIAIMLGRLGMTVDECIKAYRKVAERAFTPKRTALFPARPSGAFSATALETAIRDVVKENCVVQECTAASACPHGDIEFRDASCTATVVLAITKDNVDAQPTLFTTYDSSAGLQECKIWQVARATSAATTFFKPIQVGRDGIEFIDAGFGYNNPCEVLTEEAQRRFPGRKLQVLSIGTGIGDVVGVDSKRDILMALKKMETSSKKVADRLDSLHGDDGQYFRFNVERGLQHTSLSAWEKAGTISAHTTNYLNENIRLVAKFTDEFLGRGKDLAQGGSAGDAGGTVISQQGTPARQECHYLPFSKNRRFVGRTLVLDDVKERLFGNRSSQKVAVVGLGGVGKTQLALSFAYWVKDNRSDYSVFWVPATTKAAFEAAYIEMSKILPITQQTKDEDPKLSVRRYLGSKAAGPWLLVVDNADDPEVLSGSSDVLGGIEKYLPESEDGLTLFTTRSREVAVDIVGPGVVELYEMNQQEAMSLMKGSLTRTDSISDTVLHELLDELAHLPLAIIQAAAYINKNQSVVSVGKYLEMLRSSEQKELFSLLSRGFHDSTRYRGSQNAVATTWLVSFEQIRKSDPDAANLLLFLSCIEPKGIPQTILPLSDLGEQTVHAIGTLCGFAFLTRRGESHMFDMHRLVHVATRIWIERQENLAEKTEADAIRHIATIFPSFHIENREIWRQYLPHTLRLLYGSQQCQIVEKYNLFFSTGTCLSEDRRFKEAITCLIEVYKWSGDHLAEDHPSRLALEFTLAHAYVRDRRTKEAIHILEHVVKVQQQILEEDDDGRLLSEFMLAQAYLDTGRSHDSIDILEHVSKIRRHTLPEESNDRLASEHELARAYLANRRILDAASLLEYVVGIRRRTQREDNLSRLASEQELASAYFVQGRAQESVKIQEHVVKMRRQTLKEDDYSRLIAEYNLGYSYLHNGQVKDAIIILEQVVGMHKGMLPEDDRYRLTAERELGRAYFQNEQIAEALGLFGYIVGVQSKILSEDDEFLLASEYWLARAYYSSGQVKEGIKLLEHVVTLRQRTLPEDNSTRHPSQELLRVWRSENDGRS